MTFIKKIFRIGVLFITIVLINGCNQPPEYFNELKETDLLIYPEKQNEINISTTTATTNNTD
ncbi:MAG: hypothetical protein SNJ64_00520 [Endomicrobiia bacterium]